VSVYDKRADVASFKEHREPSLEEGGMAGKTEKPEEKPVATAFESVIAPAVAFGGKNTTVKGRLLRKDTNAGVSGANVSVTLKTPQPRPAFPAKTDSGGNFSAPLDMSGLGAGPYQYEVSFAGDEQELGGASEQHEVVILGSADAFPWIRPGEVPTDIIQPASSTNDCSPCSDLITAAKRVLRDPNMAAGISQWLSDAASNPPAWLKPGPGTPDALGLISKAFAGSDALAAKGQCCSGQLRIMFAIVDPATGIPVPLDQQLLPSIEIQVMDKNLNLASGPNRTYDGQGILISSVEAGIAYLSLSPRIADAELDDTYLATTPPGTSYAAYAKGTQLSQTVPGGAAPTPAPSTVAPSTAAPRSSPGGFGYSVTIGAGNETKMVFFLKTLPAQVRCFSRLDGDDCCGQGKQFISNVAITAMQGDNFVQCQQTGSSGCSGFTLNPGWYKFRAPEEVSIDGCNYMLASSSPVNAYLGAKQCCSDIFFSYKKKENEIMVVSQICFPDTTNPNQEVRENFPGVQYLLVREDDLSFTQQQTTIDGGPLCFQNLCAATYLLFCQAPNTFNGQPVAPVFPDNGCLALRVFAGQKKSKIPVWIRFRQSTTTPAVLNGVVRDDTGQPNPGQLVQVRNNMGALVVAGLTDSNGVYSIQMYAAENVTLMFGTQQIPISKTQILAAMKTGPAALPAPATVMQEALEATQFVGVGN
jgi:hypothetical protein